MTTEKTISILGLRGAGKTTFLTVLNLALALDQSPWRIRPINTTIKEMSIFMNTLFVLGEYPPPTIQETKLEFIVEKTATRLGLKPGAKFQLKAADVPGEAVKGGYSENSEIYINFYEQNMRDCSGIIFLLDPNQVWLSDKKATVDSADDYYPLFSTIMAEIQQQNEVLPYIVFCVSKIDLADGQGPKSTFDKEGYFDGVESLAEEILGRSTKALIDQTFKRERIKWFPISATGFTGDGDNRCSQLIKKPKASGTFVDGIRNPRDLQPIGVAEAFEWVLDSLAEDDEDIHIIDTRGKWYANLLKILRRSMRI